MQGIYSFHSYTKMVAPSCEERIMIENVAAMASSMISSYQRDEIARARLSLSNTLMKLGNHIGIDGFIAAEYKKLLNTLEADTIILCHPSQPVAIYGNEDISHTPKECQVLLNESGSKHAVLCTSLGGVNVSFFSVRYLLVAFLRRRSMIRHVRWTGQADAPLNDQKKSHPRVSFNTFMKQAEGKPEPWSTVSIDLLGVMRQGISSFLFAEVLPAGVQEVFAQVSHELRTLFHGVMGSLEILRTGRVGMDIADQNELLDSAIVCGTSMLSTLDNIIHSVSDRNNTEVVQSRFAASEPIHMAMASMQHYAAKKALGLSTTASNEPINMPTSTTSMTPGQDGNNANLQEVIGDIRRIKHVVQILMHNAIKFTPCGGKVKTSLVNFDPWQGLTEWCSKETERFESNSWLGNPLPPLAPKTR